MNAHRVAEAINLNFSGRFLPEKFVHASALPGGGLVLRIGSRRVTLDADGKAVSGGDVEGDARQWEVLDAEQIREARYPWGVALGLAVGSLKRLGVEREEIEADVSAAFEIAGLGRDDALAFLREALGP